MQELSKEATGVQPYGCAAERVCSLTGVQLNGCAALPRKDSSVPQWWELILTCVGLDKR